MDIDLDLWGWSSGDGDKSKTLTHAVDESLAAREALYKMGVRVGLGYGTSGQETHQLQAHAEHVRRYRREQQVV